MEMLRQFCMLSPVTDDKGTPVLAEDGTPRMRNALAPHHPLNTTIWDRQPFYEIQNMVRGQCDDIAEQFRGFTAEVGHRILEIGRFAWFDLERGYSREEGAAMGHCGNISGERDAMQTILSYREGDPKKGWKPHLTFILHRDANGQAWLGEMKGRKNSKPQEKWHHAIVELLKSPIVNEVRGGGYLVEANFCLYYVQGAMERPLNGWTDLSLDLATALHEARPEIWLHNGTCEFCRNTTPDWDDVLRRWRRGHGPICLKSKMLVSSG
jgi:hypothetical protein